MPILVDNVEHTITRIRELIEGWGGRLHVAKSLHSGPTPLDIEIASREELEASLAAARPTFVFHEPVYHEKGYPAGDGPLVVEVHEGARPLDRAVAVGIGWLHQGVLIRAVVADAKLWNRVGGRVVDQLKLNGGPDICFEELVESMSPRAFATMLVEWIHEQDYVPYEHAKRPEKLVDEAIDAHGPVPADLEDELQRKLRECRRVAIKMMRGEVRM